MKMIETKEQLDSCKAVAEFVPVGTFKVDALKVVASFHKVNPKVFRRVNAVFNFRLNNGLKNNPYNKNDEMFEVYELLFVHNRGYHTNLMNFLQMDVEKEKFDFVHLYKENSTEVISAYKEVELNPELYPEALL